MSLTSRAPVTALYLPGVVRQSMQVGLKPYVRQWQGRESQGTRAKQPGVETLAISKQQSNALCCGLVDGEIGRTK